MGLFELLFFWVSFAAGVAPHFAPLTWAAPLGRKPHKQGYQVAAAPFVAETFEETVERDMALVTLVTLAGQILYSPPRPDPAWRAQAGCSPQKKADSTNYEVVSTICKIRKERARSSARGCQCAKNNRSDGGYVIAESRSLKKSSMRQLRKQEGV